MSASERLRALWEANREPYYDSGPRDNNAEEIGYVLRDALPLIANCIEQAEVLYAEAATAAPLWDGINNSLQALEAHLNGSS